jgi:hypothetical protein
MLRRDSRAWRLLAPLVMAVQLAAVTVVPVAHPYVHHRSGGQAALAGALLTLPGSSHEELRSQDLCVACLASPGILVPRDTPPGALAPVERYLVPAPPDGSVPVVQVVPANRVRAPPLA